MRWALLATFVLVGCRPRPAAHALDTSDRSALTLTQIHATPPLPPLPESSPRPTFESLDWFARGRDALLRNDPVTASGFLDKAAHADPDRYEIQLARGTAYLETGDVETALAALDLASRLRPSAIEPSLLSGKLLLNNDRADEAVDRFRRAVTAAGPADDGRATAAHLWLARALRAARYTRASADEYSVVARRLNRATDDLRDDPDVGYLVDHPAVFAAETHPS